MYVHVSNLQENQSLKSHHHLDILFDILSAESLTLLVPTDAMLFDLDTRYSLPMYISTLRLHALPLRLTISELRSLPNASSVPTFLPNASSVPINLSAQFSLVAIGFLTLMVLLLVHRHHLLLTRRNWVSHPFSSWTNNCYQERESGTQPPLCNSDSDPNQKGEADISVVLIDSVALLLSVAAKIGRQLPTRELALQTSQVCKELSKYLNIQVMVTTGGTSLRDDIIRLHQPLHLLVGTPGRILDLTKKRVCVLKDWTMLVMDEVSSCTISSFCDLLLKV
ncbi:unnamed protein product [Brassica napus]|uniref:(rape) hypothetical protein n=1 Tax=Brassica napus TaxID=3708 RepID=A0A816IP34_BRANA|nr:unnamed protein product [Brassica napus]